MATILSGFSICLSLIVAIGAQNAFILKQGLKKEHILPLILICVLSDALLITLGILGFGALIKEITILHMAVKWLGIIFLVVYGIKSLINAFNLKEGMNASNLEVSSLKKSILLCLTFTWLNPHVYLDTVFLIGTISTQFAPDEFLFGLGACMASFFLFFSLGYGARLLQPIFIKPISWKILDIIIAIIMFTIAVQIFLKY